MRTGLVILGSVIAVLGVGLVITLFFLGGSPASTSQISVENVVIGPTANFSEVFFPPSGGAVSLTISWSSTGPANVALSPAYLCAPPSGYCTSGPPVLSWSGVTSGKGTVSPVDASAYILRVVNPGNGTIHFSAGISVAYQAPTAIPVWAWWLIAGGGVVLLGIGGIALFLGLFLPGGVYSANGPPPEGRRPLDLPPGELEGDPGFEDR